MTTERQWQGLRVRERQLPHGLPVKQEQTNIIWTSAARSLLQTVPKQAQQSSDLIPALLLIWYSSSAYWGEMQHLCTDEASLGQGGNTPWSIIQQDF